MNLTYKVYIKSNTLGVVCICPGAIYMCMTIILKHISQLFLSKSTTNYGERGGLLVESLTPEREVGGLYLSAQCCVLEQRHIYSLKSTGNT